MTDPAALPPAMTRAPAAVSAEDLVMQLTGGLALEDWRRMFTAASLKNDLTSLLRIYNADLVARATAAEAEAARLREALRRLEVLLPMGDERRAIINDALCTPTPPTVATVAPEGPSELLSTQVVDVGYAVVGAINDMISSAHENGGTAYKRVLDHHAISIARALDRLAGRGRA